MTTGNRELAIRIGGRLGGAMRDIERLESKLQGATRGFDKLRSSAAATGGRIRSALGGFGAADGADGAVAALGDFEETLARIVGLVGVAKGKVDTMGQALLRMGPEVARSLGLLDRKGGEEQEKQDDQAHRRGDEEEREPHRHDPIVHPDNLLGESHHIARVA